MSKSAENGKFNNAELRIYELIGIKLFKKAILFFERAKHRKDGGQNENYHIKGLSQSSLKSFSGYLLYNCTLHIIAILLLIIYFIIAALADITFLWLDLLLIAVGIFNLYCILLQRYTYLRLNSHIIKSKAKNKRIKEKKADELFCSLKERKTDQIRTEAELIKKIRNAAITGGECLLTDNDLPALKSISNLFEATETVHISKNQWENAPTLFKSLDLFENKNFVITSTERRVSSLQRLLGVKKQNNILFGYTVITDSAECEAQYRKIFPLGRKNSVEQRISLLYSAYSKAQKHMAGGGE